MTIRFPYSFSLLAALALASPASSFAASPDASDEPVRLKRTGFEHGSAGWLAGRVIPGELWVDRHHGNDAPAIRHIQRMAQGSMLFQRRNSWLTPIRSGQPVAFQFQTKANVVKFLGHPTQREVVLELRDYDNPPPGLPYTSVWTIAGYLDSKNLPGWQTWRVEITDPGATALPEGWGGYGAEDKRGRPMLPPDRTFADVLANVDEIAITTFQPGYAYGSYHDFDVLYDNFLVTTLPAAQ